MSLLTKRIPKGTENGVKAFNKLKMRLLQHIFNAFRERLQSENTSKSSYLCKITFIRNIFPKINVVKDQ